MTQPISNQRHLFDIPADVTYINCAYLSPLLRSAAERGIWGVGRKVRPWTIVRRDFYDEVEETRAAFARLTGAAADDVALIPSTSYGAATAAANLSLAKGQSIVLIEGEHSSNVRIWHVMARDAGARIVTVARPGDGDWTAAVLAAIDPSTAIVALPNLHWTDGGLIDLAAVGVRTRAVGAAYVIDGTQSIGAFPLDLKAVQPDFLVCSAYKWLLCPYTLAFLYAAPHRQNGRPLEQHGFNRAGAETAEGATDYPEAFQPGARRYDMGERSNFIHLPMAIVALKQLAAWGPSNIAATLKPLTDALAEGGRALGLSAPPDSRRVPHMIGLSRPGQPLPPDLAQKLARQKIHVSQRGPALRISPHLYNSAADVERLLGALKPLL
jgi:selenocysteine lyase/cysteine desulfurase